MRGGSVFSIFEEFKCHSARVSAAKSSKSGAGEILCSVRLPLAIASLQGSQNDLLGEFSMAFRWQPEVKQVRCGPGVCGMM